MDHEGVLPRVLTDTDACPLDMSAVVDFLNERIDEDGRAVGIGPLRNWYVAPDSALCERTAPDHGYEMVPGHVVRGQLGTMRAQHIARHDPVRIYREVKAKDRHIARWRQIDELLAGSGGVFRNELLSVRRAYMLVILDDAACYADHPDYRPEWKPLVGP